MTLPVLYFRPDLVVWMTLPVLQHLPHLVV